MYVETEPARDSADGQMAVSALLKARTCAVGATSKKIELNQNGIQVAQNG